MTILFDLRAALIGLIGIVADQCFELRYRRNRKEMEDRAQVLPPVAELVSGGLADAPAAALDVDRFLAKARPSLAQGGGVSDVVSAAREAGR